MIKKLKLKMQKVRKMAIKNDFLSCSQQKNTHIARKGN